MRVFLYGTLMDPAVFARAGGTDAPLATARPALLAGWRRVALRGTPYPTLVRDRTGVVDGLVADLPARTLAALHAYEGPLYRFVPVRVLTGGALIAARAWIAPERRADRRRPWSP